MENEESKPSNVIPLIQPESVAAPELIVLGEIPTPELVDQPAPEAPPLMLRLFADAGGITELEMSRDPEFVMGVFVGFANLIARTLYDNNTKRSPTTSEFLREMANLRDAAEAMREKAQSETPVN